MSVELMAIGSDERSIEGGVRAAQAICPLIGQVHQSTLWVLAKIFAGDRDRRVKRGGILFAAYLLLHASLVQRSLFEGTEVGDVARICIPNVLKLCRAEDWPWCYDTTLKYLRLLVTAGVLLTRPGEPGIYYLPLCAYVLLPEHAHGQLEKLATRRTKVSRSGAFKRTTIHCAVLDEPQIVDSPAGDPDVLLIDEGEMQRLVQSVCSTLQNAQDITLQPATIAQITRIVARHAPRVLKKRDGRFLVRSKEEAAALLNTPRSTTGSEIVDSFRTKESTILEHLTIQSDSRKQENLPSGPGSKRIGTLESTTCASNLPVAPKMVDSSDVALSDSLLTITNNNSSSEYISENDAAGPAEESTILTPQQAMVDSPNPVRGLLHPLTTDFTPAAMLAWRFPAAERSEQLPPGIKEPDALAALLSYRFERNDSRLLHYRKLLADPRTLDLAVIDGIVRSAFPDLRHHQDHLRGAWVTKQFRAYRAGLQVESTILAWANTTYSYAAIQTILEESARWQAAQLGHMRHRPLPEELIVDSSLLRDFWLNGGAWSLQGDWQGVDLDGELLTCEQYEQTRLRSLEQGLADAVASPELPPDMEYEISTYHEWLVSPLLAHPPRKLLPFLHTLEQVLDQERFLLDMKIVLEEDGRGRWVITVQERSESTQTWTLLRNGEEVDTYLVWYEEQSGQVHDDRQEGGEQQ